MKTEIIFESYSGESFNIPLEEQLKLLVEVRKVFTMNDRNYAGLCTVINSLASKILTHHECLKNTKYLGQIIPYFIRSNAVKYFDASPNDAFWWPDGSSKRIEFLDAIIEAIKNDINNLTINFYSY